MAFKIKTEKGLRMARSHAPTCIPAFFQSHCKPLLAIYSVSVYAKTHAYIYIYTCVYVYI